MRRPTRGQRGDDRADAVVPLDGVVVLEGGVGIRVRTGFVGIVVPHPRTLVEVRVLHREVCLAQAPVRDRMELDEVQSTSRPQERVDDARPFVDVGKPAERADAGVDAVERRGHPEWPARRTRWPRRTPRRGRRAPRSRARHRSREPTGRRRRRARRGAPTRACRGRSGTGGGRGPTPPRGRPPPLRRDEVASNLPKSGQHRRSRNRRASATRSSHHVRLSSNQASSMPDSAPVRATTASSTGGMYGGRCWRGLGGREQPSLPRTLRSQRSGRNKDLQPRAN